MAYLSYVSSELFHFSGIVGYADLMCYHLTLKKLSFNLCLDIVGNKESLIANSVDVILRYHE